MRNIKDISPTEFENLVFDMIRSSGMRNLVWRTPGSDGGRDIEGQHLNYDFSGSSVLDTWYIEAKHYQSAVDWPTVWEKIAYAQNARAQYLLLVTTSSFSPKCLDEISKWNSHHSDPKIRCWAKSELEHRLRLQPAIVVKYGLAEHAERLIPALSPLSNHLAKATMAARETLDCGQSPLHYLECAAALSELLLVRSKDLSTQGRIVSKSPIRGETWYPWLERPNPFNPRLFDGAALRALASAILVISRGGEVKVKAIDEHVLHFATSSTKSYTLLDGQDLIDTILLWGDLEASISAAELTVKSRMGGAQ